LVNAAPASHMASDAPVAIWPPISPSWQLLAPAQFAILKHANRYASYCIPGLL